MFTISLAAFHAPPLLFLFFFFAPLLLFLWEFGKKKISSGLCVSENVCIYYLFVSVREWSLAITTTTTTTTRESENYISKVLGS